MEARDFWGYTWGYLLSRLGVFFKMALTDTTVKKAKAIDKTYRLSDAGGLYLLVTPTGSRLWRWKYRYEGKEKLMAFGKYPEVPLALARERHSDARRLLAGGTDPMAERKEAKTAERTVAENSFQSISDLWLEHWQDGKSLRHVDYVKRRIKADILPCLGEFPITKIGASDVVAMAKKIEQRGARDIAKRALETCRAGLSLRHCSWLHGA